MLNTTVYSWLVLQHYSITECGPWNKGIGSSMHVWVCIWYLVHLSQRCGTFAVLYEQKSVGNFFSSLHLALKHMAKVRTHRCGKTHDHGTLLDILTDFAWVWESCSSLYLSFRGSIIYFSAVQLLLSLWNWLVLSFTHENLWIFGFWVKFMAYVNSSLYSDIISWK